MIPLSLSLQPKPKKMRPFLLAFSLLTALQLSATGDSLHYLLPTDSLILRIDYGGTLLFNHKLAPRQTLYSLAKFYGLKLEEVYAYNPDKRFGGYEIGDPITVPIPLKAILRDQPADYRSGRYVPVFYRVRKGDTVFGISRRYFDIPLDIFRQRNRLADDELTQNQCLLVGWMLREGIDPELQLNVGGPYARMNLQYKMRFQREAAKRKVAENRGKAAWTRSDNLEVSFLALHRTAPINSIIEVSNPMNGRTFYLRVVGRIAGQLYDRHTIVVIPPFVVKALGARDDSFYVRVKNY